MPLYTISFFNGSGVLTHVERREHPDDISALDVSQSPKSGTVEIREGKRRVAVLERSEPRQRHHANLETAETHPLVFDWLLNCTRPETKLAREYWRSLEAAGRQPKRADLRPMKMKAFLPHVGLIDVRPGPDRKDYFIRLAGSRWEGIFGSMSGRLLQAFLPPHIEARWRLLFDTVCARKEPARVSTRLGFKDMTWLATEMFVAPLGEDDSGTSSLFMCFTSWNVNET